MEQLEAVSYEGWISSWGFDGEIGLRWGRERLVVSIHDGRACNA
jgi:hypothetical protein